MHFDDDEDKPESKPDVDRELRVKTNLQGFTAAEHGFTMRAGVVYRPNGKPAALCPICTLPGTVVRVLGVFRQHRCCGYESMLGCGHAWWTMAWRVSQGPYRC